MFHETRSRAENALNKFREPSKFLRAWVEAPLTTGAVAPSGAVLAQRMAEFVPVDSKNPVLELGPGTGPVTKAILEAGVSKERLTCLEFSSDFCKHLSEKFDELHVVQGDAYDMYPSLRHIEPNSLCAVVSSLPLISRPMDCRLKCIRDAFTLMRPGAPFIQFSYSLVSPVSLNSRLFSWSKTGWIIRNIPPARIWVYRKPF